MKGEKGKKKEKKNTRFGIFCAHKTECNRNKQKQTAQFQNSVWNVCYWKPDQKNSKYDETWWQHASRCLQTPQIEITQKCCVVWSQIKFYYTHTVWIISVTFGQKHLRIFFSTTPLTTKQGLPKTRLKMWKKETMKKTQKWKRNDENTEDTKKNEAPCTFSKQHWNGSIKKPMKRKKKCTHDVVWWI